MRFGLSDSQVDAFIAVLKRSGVQRAVVFGSRAKGNYRPESDIDLAVTGGGVNVQRLWLELDELPFPHKIDVIDYDQISNPELKAHIDRVGQAMLG